ncbi:MAG: CotH kinase family protein [Pseudomonadales bacterium]|nr:CotH kinase family protein [Pseudomonadales bacterium]
MPFVSLQRLWRLSWILLLPLLGIFGLWASNTWERYQIVALKQLGDKTLGGISLHEIGVLEAGFIGRRAAIDVSHIGQQPPATRLPEVSLFVAEADIKKLNRDLPASGKDYVDAAILDDNKVRKISTRYRGDFHMHWAFPKKSWRIKTKKKRLYNGLRKFNLIIPKTSNLYSNYMGYQIAGKLGVLVPQHDLVRLTINGEPQGIYLLAEQLDESTLRNNGLMPGDIYAGDQAFGEEVWRGLHRLLFDYPGLWEKTAIYNHYDDEHRAPIRALLEALRNQESEAGQAQLETLLDLESFARFNIFETYAGTHHFDTTHNWKLYYDPARHRFYPLLWDPIPWYPDWLPGYSLSTWLDGEPPPYVVVSPITHALHRNANFLRIRNRLMEEFLASEEPDNIVRQLQNLRQQLSWEVTQERAQLSHDLHLVTPDEALAAMEKTETLAQTINAAMRKRYVEQPPLLQYRQLDEHSVLLAMNGYRTTQALNLQLASPTDASTVTLEVMRGAETTSVTLPLPQNQNQNQNQSQNTAGLITLPLALTGDLHWVSASRTYNDTVQNRTATYLLRFDQPVSINSLRATFATAEYPVEENPALQQTRLERLFRVTGIETPVAPLRLSGDMHISGSQDYAQPVVIEAGTHITLAPDVVLMFRKGLDIEGTAAAPVVITAAETAPWGAVILEGQGNNGSRLSHFSLSGGSGYKDDMADYSGMLSVHDVTNVTLADCHLADSRIYDDMMHAVYSSVIIERCRFERSAFDAVDLDMSAARITDTVFSKSGNDGLDLMGTTAVVTNTRFESNGDKGISVGERSLVAAADLTFTGNAVGLQSKDDSRVYLQDVTLQDNQAALDAYYKNWRYGTGGQISYCDLTLAKNQSDITFDKRSAINQVDCAAIRAGSDKLKQDLTVRLAE